MYTSYKNPPYWLIVQFGGYISFLGDLLYFEPAALTAEITMFPTSSDTGAPLEQSQITLYKVKERV